MALRTVDFTITSPWSYASSYRDEAGYTYAGDNPVNFVDPSGYFSVSGLAKNALSVAAVGPYALYYGAYQVGGASALPYELSGLAGDVAIDYAKQKLGAEESVCDEGISGGIFPRFIAGGGPQTYFGAGVEFGDPCAGL